ncbi:hypothetical protein EJ04DRAFT_496079 [Polyplosphaeria fusca]|uniref:U6 small nuclear RNA (adenine-(43)-N(6))-methyltransferase n=1 Tax=Polyplosphaeria fusca TaxID=682080 RepID=A0A9P4V177_9PLEO|nr:hypothetical protein EJ04DRAFT_496079 [Polyplosphaeria fusca]
MDQASSINFPALAAADAEFAKFYEETKGKGGLDFFDKATQQALTKATLRVHHGLELVLPDDRLCPPIPNRNIYVSWIKNLIDSTNPDYSAKYDPERKVVGLDIGTGASAIYTLLLLNQRPNWIMCATEVDTKSFNYAIQNISLNSFGPRTKPLLTIGSNAAIPFHYLGVPHLDFTVCNPPFFETVAEMRRSLAGDGKAKPPYSISNAAPNEMLCPGGDLGFVTKMVNESLALKEKVTWFTTMFGKLESAKAIIKLLQQHGIENWAVGCIEPGGHTKRWVVGWSFGDYRPHNVHFISIAYRHEYLPFPTQYRIDLTSKYSLKDAKATVNEQLSSLDLEWRWDEATSSGVGIASQNVWNRQYRRQKQKQHMAKTSEIQGQSMTQRDNSIGMTKEIIIDWLRGTNRTLWESLCGLMHRKFKVN